MVTWQRRTIFYLALLLLVGILVACSAAASEPSAVNEVENSAAPPISAPVEQSVPVSDVAESAQVVESVAKADVAAAQGVLITAYTLGHNVLRLVDPQTGEDIAGHTPIDLGRDYYEAVLSPDGQTLAYIAYPAHRLQIVDLVNWQDRGTEHRFFNMQTLAFSPDGSQLAIAYRTQGAAANLALVDVATHTILADTQLNFVPRPGQLHFTPDGQNIAAYGSVYHFGSETPDAPHAALLQTSDLSVLWETELEGIKDGSWCENCNSEAVIHIIWEPGVAFSTDQMAFYVVHADADRLTTVNLRAQTVQTVDIEAKKTALDAVLAWLFPIAEAKEAEFTTKQAMLSPDGTRLYVVGAQHGDQTETGFDPTYVHHSGLQVVDVATGIVLNRRDMAGEGLILSADGSHLYVHGADGNSMAFVPDATNNWQPWTEVLDLETLEPVARIEGWWAGEGTRLDGTPVVFGWRYGGESAYLTLFTPGTFQVVQEWSPGADGLWLAMR